MADPTTVDEIVTAWDAGLMLVAMVTSERFPEDHWRDQDTPEVVRWLERLGVEADVVAWDGPAPVRWERYDTLVLQSPWSMWRALDVFGAWLDQRVAEGAHLLNPAGVVSLGTDKRYLGRLAARGVATVPTTVVDDGDDRDEEQVRDEFAALLPTAGAADPPGRRSVVVKPLSAGGALGAREFPATDLAGAVSYVRELGRAGVATIAQPYMNAIDTHRELGVVVTGGRISHAITKAAILRPGDAHHAFHPDPRPYHGLTAPERTIIENVYRHLVEILPPGTPEPLSLRLDFILDPASEPPLLLLEAETVAPVKFFPLFPPAGADYARLIVDRTTARAAPAPAGGPLPPDSSR